MMRPILLVCLLVGIASPAPAQRLENVFRPVSFICRDGITGTSVKIEENVLGHRKRYEVSYFNGRPTLFVISKSRNGRTFRRVGLIDLRSEPDPDNIEAAHYLASMMGRDSEHFCRGSRRKVLAARYQLQANHYFNLQHPRYRGR